MLSGYLEFRALAFCMVFADLSDLTVTVFIATLDSPRGPLPPATGASKPLARSVVDRAVSRFSLNSRWTHAIALVQETEVFDMLMSYLPGYSIDPLRKGTCSSPAAVETDIVLRMLGASVMIVHNSFLTAL